MRKLKTISIEGRGEVTTREVSVKGVYQLWSAVYDALPDKSKEQKEAQTTKNAAYSQVKIFIQDCLSVDWGELTNWYPSEIEQLIEPILEVNSAFLGIARKLKVDKTVTNLLLTLQGGLPVLLAESLSEDTEKSGDTAGVSSSKHYDSTANNQSKEE